MKRTVGIGARMAILLFAVLLLFAGMSAMMTRGSRRVEAAGADRAAELMMALQRDKIRVATHTMALALGTAAAHADDPEAKYRLIREMVKPVRFEADESGYFFVYGGTVNVALPTKPEFQGRDLGNTADENGVFYVRELAEAARAGGGFVENDRLLDLHGMPPLQGRMGTETLRKPEPRPLRPPTTSKGRRAESSRHCRPTARKFQENSE